MFSQHLGMVRVTNWTSESIGSEKTLSDIEMMWKILQSTVGRDIGREECLLLHPLRALSNKTLHVKKLSSKSLSPTTELSISKPEKEKS